MKNLLQIEYKLPTGVCTDGASYVTGLPTARGSIIYADSNQVALYLNGWVNDGYDDDYFHDYSVDYPWENPFGACHGITITLQANARTDAPDSVTKGSYAMKISQTWPASIETSTITENGVTSVLTSAFPATTFMLSHQCAMDHDGHATSCLAYDHDRGTSIWTVTDPAEIKDVGLAGPVTMRLDMGPGKSYTPLVGVAPLRTDNSPPPTTALTDQRSYTTVVVNATGKASATTSSASPTASASSTTVAPAVQTTGAASFNMNALNVAKLGLLGFVCAFLFA